MIQYPGGDDVSFAEGYINKIIDKNILYTMNTEFGSSGSPLILDTRNLKIIGIHYSKSLNNNDEKKAIFMKYIIKDIEKQLKNNNNNFNDNYNNNTINNLNNKNKFNDNKNKILYNNPNSKNNNNKLYSQNNNYKKDIIQNNQIQKFQPIGKNEWNKKILDLYSGEQFEKNNRCW